MWGLGVVNEPGEVMMEGDVMFFSGYKTIHTQAQLINMALLELALILEPFNHNVLTKKHNRPLLNKKKKTHNPEEEGREKGTPTKNTIWLGFFRRNDNLPMWLI